MNLRAIRKELGLSQREMAAALGLPVTSRHNISNMERGHRTITAGMAARIALLRIMHRLGHGNNVFTMLDEIETITREGIFHGSHQERSRSQVDRAA